MKRAGLSLPVIGALLGHTQTRTTARCAPLYDDPLRKASETAGAVVTGAKKADVLKLREGAAYAPVVAVTATDARRAIFNAANRGRYVEIAAPGVDIWTPMTSQHGAYASGTSYAVPFVAAVAAVFRGARPKATVRQFRSYLQRTARDLGPLGRDPIFGWGLVQAPRHCRPTNTLVAN